MPTNVLEHKLEKQIHKTVQSNLQEDALKKKAGEIKRLLTQFQQLESPQHAKSEALEVAEEVMELLMQMRLLDQFRENSIALNFGFKKF